MLPLLNRTVVQNAWVVNDLDEAMARWTRVFGIGPFFCNPDIRVSDPRFAYMDTSSALGVMVEILENVESVRSAFANIKAVCDSWDGITDPVRGSAMRPTS